MGTPCTLTSATERPAQAHRVILICAPRLLKVEDSSVAPNTGSGVFTQRPSNGRQSPSRPACSRRAASADTAVSLAAADQAASRFAACSTPVSGR